MCPVRRMPLDCQFTDPLLDVERVADGLGPDTLGWLVRYAGGPAVWCGEVSRSEFLRLATPLRTALRDDLGWFVADVEHRVSPDNQLNIIGKVCDERAGLEMAKAIAMGRHLMQLSRSQCATSGVAMSLGSPDGVQPPRASNG